MNTHIVIAGGGRVGINVGSILHGIGFPFIIVEQDYRRYEKVKAMGYPVIFGDTTHESIVDVARLRHARLMIITVPSIIVARQVVRIARGINPDIAIIARAESVEHMEELRGLDIQEVVQPEFEASLELIRQALIYYGLPVPSVHACVDDIRFKNYSPLYKGNVNNRLLLSLKNASQLFQMYWVEIAPGGRSVGKTIEGLRARSVTGASVVGIYRDGAFSPNPEPSAELRGNDLVAIIGDERSRKLFEELVN